MTEESKPGETYIAVETILAAAVDALGGVIKVPAETFEKDLSGYVLAMDFDYQTEMLIITLVDKETAQYEDE